MYHCFAGPGEYKVEVGIHELSCAMGRCRQLKFKLFRSRRNVTWDTEIKSGLKSSKPRLALSEPLIKLGHLENGTTQATFELPGKWYCHQFSSPHAQRGLHCCWRVRRSLWENSACLTVEALKGPGGMPVLARKVKCLSEEGEGTSSRVSTGLCSTVEMILVFSSKTLLSEVHQWARFLGSWSSPRVHVLIQLNSS